MSLKQLLELEPDDIMKMKRPQLAKIVSRLATAANKRYKRLEPKPELHTPVFNGVKRSGGAFGTKKKNLNQLRVEYTRVSAFLRNPQSTVKGAQKAYKELTERIGGNLRPSEMKELWEIFHQVQELEPHFLSQNYESVFPFIRSQIVEKRGKPFDTDEIVKNAVDLIKEKYEEKQENEKRIDMGEFFDPQE